MSEKKRNYIGMFNLAKGLLLIAIVIGHTLNIYFKYWEIESVSKIVLVPLSGLKSLFYGAIPSFFLIYGYTFRAKTIGECVKEQWRYILSKYVIIAFIIVCAEAIKALLRGRDVLDTVKSFGVSFLLGVCPGETELNGLYIHSIGPAWFLLSMAIGSIILTILFKLDTKFRSLLILVMVAFSTGLAWHYIIPFCIVQTMVCVAYMYCGYCLRKDKWLLSDIKPIEVVILIAILVLTVPRGNIEVSQNVWDLKMLDFMGSLAAGLLLLKLFIWMDGFKGKISNIVRTVGIHSLDVFVVHSIEYVIFPWEKIGNVITSKSWGGFIIVLFGRAMVICAGCLLLSFYRKLFLRRSADGRQR